MHPEIRVSYIPPPPMHISFDVFAYFSANFANISRPSQKNTAKIGYNRRKMVTCVTVDGARKDGGFFLGVDAMMIRILFIDKRSDVVLGELLYY